mmetsp:Transcript_7977/g.24051  ORF Transcript_7977/g.24051 Transcript_7977/m.24051 type:complete len:215 (+) Transcript_7977:235-879(+)
MRWRHTGQGSPTRMLGAQPRHTQRCTVEPWRKPAARGWSRQMMQQPLSESSLSASPLLWVVNPGGGGGGADGSPSRPGTPRGSGALRFPPPIDVPTGASPFPTPPPAVAPPAGRPPVAPLPVLLARPTSSPPAPPAEAAAIAAAAAGSAPCSRAANSTSLSPGCACSRMRAGVVGTPPADSVWWWRGGVEGRLPPHDAGAGGGAEFAAQLTGLE